MYDMSVLYKYTFPSTVALRSESTRRLLFVTSKVELATVTKSHLCLPGGMLDAVLRKTFESYFSDKETEGITVV
jgi:hypothetical protein